ncbi:hypothetical protein SAMN05660380_01456 [Xylella fastidiosa]|jgi:hypothetical protein|nr:hypothetical protein SAMN05660380_01456 [Xylella fastidiosa]
MRVELELVGLVESGRGFRIGSRSIGSRYVGCYCPGVVCDSYQVS